MGALDGIRVLDLTVVVQGPQAAQLLADLGADVVKIELPGFGDFARWIALSADDRRSAFWEANNRGKRSVTLDLRTPGGQAVLRRLVETADVLVSNFRPGTLDAWNVGYDALAAINPRLVYAAGSALGPLGPEATREGADITGQASGGLISTIGEDGSFPSPVGVVIADHCGAQNLVIGILAALVARQQTGRGQRVEVSLLGGQIWAQASEITGYLLTGKLSGRANRGHPLLGGLWQLFATSDGHLAITGAGRDLWPGFCRALERPDLLDDPRFAGGAVAAEHRQALLETVGETFRTRTTAAWCERLRAEAQRFAPVQDYAQLAVDPQVWANGYLVEAEHPQWGRITTLGCPIQLSTTPAKPGVATPELGQHTEAVLLEAGYSWDEIVELREQGAL